MRHLTNQVRRLSRRAGRGLALALDGEQDGTTQKQESDATTNNTSTIVRENDSFPVTEGAAANHSNHAFRVTGNSEP